jgi:protein SEY1
LRKRAWLALRARVDEQTADNAILAKLRAHFEERFRYDEQGVPRVWRPGDDIDGIYKRAKEETIELIPLYSRIAPRAPAAQFTLPSEPANSLDSTDDFDFPATLIVFSEMRALDLGTRFRREADAAYVEAKRSTVSSVAQIPLWMYGVLVVLGWNEAMAVLFNPLYFAAMLVTIVTAYAPLHSRALITMLILLKPLES